MKITKEEFKRRSIEVITTDNFGVDVNSDTLTDAIADDQLLKSAKANGAMHHVNADVVQMLTSIKADVEKLNPVAKFFSEPLPSTEPVKKLTKTQREKKEIEEHYAMLDNQLKLEVLKQKG